MIRNCCIEKLTSDTEVCGYKEWLCGRLNDPSCSDLAVTLVAPLGTQSINVVEDSDGNPVIKFIN